MTEDKTNAEVSVSEYREDVVKTAVEFLKNPRICNSPSQKLQKFLRSKGLTDTEIKIAFERSGTFNAQYINDIPVTNQPSLPVQQYYTYPPQNLFHRIRDILQSVAVFSAIGYALYLFYKKYIRPWLFGEKKKKSIEDSIAELNQSVQVSITDIKDNLTEVKTQVDIIKNLHTDSSSTHLQLQNLKAELTSVKGILLSRKQFPPPSGTPVMPPSIPAWQLSSVPHDQDGESKEELLEVGSGSGSSETEVVTKNSDSSLEIM